jgi:hypothetical protein
MARRKPIFFNGDYGFRIERTIRDQDGAVVDIADATTKNLVMWKPDGTTVVTKGMSFLTDGTDGVLYYDMEASTITTVGEWTMQVDVVKNTSDSQFRTQKEKFEVREKIA